MKIFKSLSGIFSLVIKYNKVIFDPNEIALRVHDTLLLFIENIQKNEKNKLLFSDDLYNFLKDNQVIYYKKIKFSCLIKIDLFDPLILNIINIHIHRKIHVDFLVNKRIFRNIKDYFNFCDNVSKNVLIYQKKLATYVNRGIFTPKNEIPSIEKMIQAIFGKNFITYEKFTINKNKGFADLNEEFFIDEVIRYYRTNKRHRDKHFSFDEASVKSIWDFYDLLNLVYYLKIFYVHDIFNRENRRYIARRSSAAEYEANDQAMQDFQNPWSILEEDQ